MAYLIPKGTRIIVRKPSGELVDRRCKEDCLFQNFEKVSEQQTIQFKRDGFVVSVKVADVTVVRYRCPQCGVSLEMEGLCDECRKTWLPRT